MAEEYLDLADLAPSSTSFAYADLADLAPSAPTLDYRMNQPVIDNDYGLGSVLGDAFGKTASDVAAIPQLFGSRLVTGAAGVGEAVAGIAGYEDTEAKLSAFQDRWAKDRAERLGEGTRGALHPVELGANLLNIPMIALTGGVGLTAMGAQAAGSEYHEARSEGASRGQAAVSGVVSGAAEFAFSKLVGDAKVAKAIKGLTGSTKAPLEAVKFLASTGNREGVDELLTTITQRFGQGLTYKDEFYDKDTLKQVLESYAAGGIIGSSAPLPKLGFLARRGAAASSEDLGTQVIPEGAVPGIAADDALAQVRDIKAQSLAAKIAQEQETFAAIMRPLSQDDAEALRDYAVLEQEERRLSGQLESVRGQEKDAAALYEQLGEDGEWGLKKDTIDAISRGQEPKSKLIYDLIKTEDDEALSAMYKRIGTLEAVNDGEKSEIKAAFESDGVTKENVARLEALAIKPAGQMLGEQASKTRFLSREAEEEQAEFARMGDDAVSRADRVIEESGEDVRSVDFKADTEFAELVGMNLIQAQEALAQKRQADHEADMLLMGDPSRIDSPQAFEAQRVELEARMNELYDRREALKSTMSDSRREALSRIESGVEAESAVERLRQKALDISGATGDFSYFDSFDIESRRMGRNPYRGPEQARSRTITDAASEYRDVMYAVLPTAERRLNDKYNGLQRGQQLPLNEIGAPMTREEFVLQETNALVSSASQKLQQLLQEGSSRDQSELVRVLDAEMLSMLKRYRVKPESVGFRGDLAMMRQGIADEGAKWIGSRMPQGRVFSELEASELVRLSQDAYTSGAPMSVHEFVEKELARRAEKLPPKDPSTAKASPDEVGKRVRNKLETDIPNELLAELAGSRVHQHPGDESWLLRTIYKSRAVFGRLRAQVMEGGQIGEGRVVNYYGPSITDPVAQMANGGKRRAAERLIKNALFGSGAVKNEIVHKFNTVLADLDRGVTAFVEQQAASGVIVSKERADQLWQTIMEKYESERTSELPEPIRTIIQKDVMPKMNELSDLAAQYAATPALAAAIKANKGRWLFRHYGIFSDKDAVTKRIAKESKPYQELFDEFKAANFNGYKDEALDAARRTFGRTKSEKELIAMAESVAEDRIYGDISAIVKSHLRPTEQAKNASRAIPTARQENMIQRVLKDPRIQALMGKETNFKLAVQHSIENLATDFAAIKLRNDLHAVFRAAGLIADAPNGVVDVPVDPKSYERFTLDDPNNVGKPVYMSPDVYNFFNAVGKQADAMESTVNQSISMLKMFALLNPGTMMQNAMSAPQALLSAWGSAAHGAGFFGGAVEMAELVRFGHYVVSELASPGSQRSGKATLSDATAKRFYINVGKTPVETIRAEVDEAIRYMVDAGGEFAFETDESTRALFAGAEKRKPGLVRSAEGVAAKGAKVASDAYKYPDVMVKWLAYKHNVHRLTWLAGLDAPTDQIKREAAEVTLKTTQDPRTTIPLVRNLSRGKLGLLTFGFAGFTYQMARNIANSGKIAVSSAVQSRNLHARADRLEKAGNVAEASKVRAMAGRYGEDAVYRTLSTSIGAYFYSHVTQKMGSMFLEHVLGMDDDEEKAYVDAVKFFSAPESRHNEVVVSNVETRMVPSKKDPEKKVNKRFVTVVNSGNLNLYDNLWRVLRSLGTPGTKPHEKVLGVVKELQYIFLSPSMATEFMAGAVGAGIKNDPNSAAWTWWKYRGEGASAGARAERMGKAVMPRAIQSPIQIASGMMGQSGIDENDPRSDKWINQAARQVTGMGSYVMDLDGGIVRRFGEEYAASSAWRDRLKKEWAAANSWDAQNALKVKYRKNVDDLMRKLSVTRDMAVSARLTPVEIEALLTDSKEYGFRLPKNVAKSLSYGYTATIEDFLPEER